MRRTLSVLGHLAGFCLIGNGFPAIRRSPWLLAYLVMKVTVGRPLGDLPTCRLRIERQGTDCLTVFFWGEDFLCVEPTGKRGISHADMVDMNRENIPGFDVREFYVNLVRDLKKRGL